MSSRERLGTQLWRARANSFGPAAEIYDRIRPGYPPAAIEWALRPLGAGAWRVMDVGAGTGIMTRQLLALGHDVLAVEPDEQMRARLGQTAPAVTALPGRAEAIPLPDAGVDAGVAAQAYHWFDRNVAHDELGRVIRPGGVFAAVWNNRDETVPWVAEYSRIVEGDRGPGGREVGPSALEFGACFEPTEVAQFRHETTHTADTLVGLLQSRSYYIVASPDRQRALEAEVRVLADTHPDLTGRAEFTLRYVTEVHRAVRRG
jgi:SAM-dependent methyltransferase